MSKSNRNRSVGNKTMVPGVGSYNISRDYNMRPTSDNRKETPKSLQLVNNLLNKHENVPSIPL